MPAASSRNAPIHAMALLRLLAQYSPVHHAHFRRLEEAVGARITKSVLRTLRRRGWLHPDIDYMWMLTEEGFRKAADLAECQRR